MTVGVGHTGDPIELLEAMMIESPEERFRTLPEPVRLEDTVVLLPAGAPADPEAGRNVDQDRATGVRETS